MTDLCIDWFFYYVYEDAVNTPFLCKELCLRSVLKKVSRCFLSRVKSCEMASITQLFRCIDKQWGGPKKFKWSVCQIHGEGISVSRCSHATWYCTLGCSLRTCMWTKTQQSCRFSLIRPFCARCGAGAYAHPQLRTGDGSGALCRDQWHPSGGRTEGSTSGLTFHLEDPEPQQDDEWPWHWCIDNYFAMTSSSLHKINYAII